LFVSDLTANPASSKFIVDEKGHLFFLPFASALEINGTFFGLWPWGEEHPMLHSGMVTRTMERPLFHAKKTNRNAN
jgi:hypothetical protein